MITDPSTDASLMDIDFADFLHSMMKEDCSPIYCSNFIDRLEPIKAQLHYLFETQRDLQFPISPEKYSPVFSLYDPIMQQCNQLEKELEERTSQIMYPALLSTIINTRKELDIIKKKLELYHEELNYFYTNAYQLKDVCFCKLIISKQPFSKPLKHKAKIFDSSFEDPLTVELITAPKASCRPIGKVIASYSIEEYTTCKSQFRIDNFEEPLDEFGSAKFYEMRFPVGSRQKVVHLQFSLKVSYVLPSSPTGLLSETVLKSEVTNPFIVMTNENQWICSEGLLFKKYLFSSHDEISWPKFANFLQERYCKATRQSLIAPQRPLSEQELNYLWNTKYLARKQSVTSKDFDAFWNWFGEVLHKIRHQKPFASMWLHGEIFGFIGRNDANTFLQSKVPGTFLFRFSEQSGDAAIAVLANQGKILHYIVQPKELDNIIELLEKYPVLQFIAPICTEFGYYETPSCVIKKSIIIQKYLVQPKPRPLSKGYTTCLSDYYISV